MAEFDYEKWKSDIEKLKKNREHVPEDLLRTKYAKGYNKLLEEIREGTEAMVRYMLISGLLIEADWDDSENNPDGKKAVDDLITRIESTINLAKIAGTFRRISYAATRDYDPEAAMELAESIRETIDREAYAPYWEKHCSLQENGTVIWNDLISMRWLKNNTWIALNERSWRLAWPPPKKMVEAIKGGNMKT